jgi:branched-subunit amino acid aminotransferase/4-amino-4-deoxychorismate lyase
VTYVEVDGVVPDAGTLASLLHRGYGHFTALQVRGGATRGLDLHLDRLERQHHTVFGELLDGEEVIRMAGHAVRDHPDASVRVVVTAGPTVTVLVDDPVEAPTTPQRLLTVGVERHVPEVKHLGTFVQGYQGRRAEAAGYDDALFVGRGGRVLETTVWNVGFVEDGTVVFPEGALLPGITMLLLLRHAPAAGVPVASRPVRVQELVDLDAAFLCNSWGVVPVAEVDDVAWPAAHPVVDRLVATYRDVPLEPLS